MTLGLRLADVFRDREHRDWEQAYQEVTRIFESLCRKTRKWPRIQALGETCEPVAAVAQQMASDFWIHLQAHPKVLQFSSIRGPGVLFVEARRFLSNVTAASTSPELAEPQLRKHLFSKVSAVLAKGNFHRLGYANQGSPRTEAKTLVNDFWGLPDLPHITGTYEDRIRIEADQDQLPADWHPKREGQTPPIASKHDIDRHLRHIFTLVRRFSSADTLTELCWNALRPANPYRSAADLVDFETITSTVDAFRDPTIERKLFEFVTSLSRDDRRILFFASDGFGIREIERTAGLPHTTISRRLAILRCELELLLNGNAYELGMLDRADTRLIGRVLRDILDCCVLQSEGEEGA